MLKDDELSRRNVLELTGGALAGAGLTGMASAAGGTIEVNVGFKNGSGKLAAQDAADGVKREFNFDAVTVELPAEAVKALEDNPNIRYVEENGQMEALAQTTPWGIDRVDADVAHADGDTGNGAEIAILDTGIDSDHYDLGSQIAGGKCFTADCCGEAGGWFCSTNSNTCHHPWDDDNDHGTHCAGSADAIDDSEGVVGVSTEATLYAGKVLDGCGSGSYDGIAAGIEWAADQGFDVASMSLGGDASSVIQDAVQYAAGKGVLLVAAAGNDGECTDCVGYPAAYDECIAVSATSEDDTLASFSSTGPEVEIAAPGEGILSTVPPESSSGGTDTLSGTSMACPHVSGAGGQLMAKGQTASEARQTLADTAEDLGLASNDQGNGLLDVEAAVDAAGGGGGNANPAVDSLSAVEVETDDSDAEFDVSWQVSDGDGNLSSVDLTLTDDTDGATEDTATVSVSGSSASGTTRLVAAGDDGSGNGYTAEALVTDTEGATGSGTTAVSETEDSGGGGEECVDATLWPDGTGSSGAENIDAVDLDGQVAETSADYAYEDFTCPDVVSVEQGGSFQIALDYSDGGYDDHYANVYVDWDGNQDWSTATETQIMSSAADDTQTYTATVDVPSDAATGGTLARVRLSWGGFDGPSATGEYGEVNDFTVFVTDSSSGGTSPAVDSLSASEASTSSSDAEFDVDWAVSDEDGNLDSVDLTLTDDTDGETEDTATVSVSGSSASQTTRLVAAGDDGSGNNYTVDITVSDTDGLTASDSTTVSAAEEISCVDATNWADGTGSSGYENIDTVDMDGQVVESSADNAYEDFTCPDVVQVQQGGSFTISLDYSDAGYDSHYANVYVDWAGDGDWSTATETQIMQNVSDDTVSYTATVDVPSDAATGATLARVRLSWNGFEGPTATGAYGEVNDFTVYVE